MVTKRFKNFLPSATLNPSQELVDSVGYRLIAPITISRRWCVSGSVIDFFNLQLHIPSAIHSYKALARTSCTVGGIIVGTRTKH